MVCGRRVSGAAKHRLHPSIYFKLEIKIKVRSSHRLAKPIHRDSSYVGNLRRALLLSLSSSVFATYIKIIFLLSTYNKDYIFIGEYYGLLQSQSN